MTIHYEQKEILFIEVNYYLWTEKSTSVLIIEPGKINKRR